MLSNAGKGLRSCCLGVRWIVCKSVQDRNASIVREGSHVLKRTSIRTKLTITLTVFSVVFCALGAAVVLSLGAYKNLASELAQHSREVQLVSDLHITAYELRGSYESQKVVASQEHGLLSSDLSENRFSYFVQRGAHFEFFGNKFEMNLEECCGLSKSRSTTLLMPELERADRLAVIKSQFASFKKLEPFNSKHYFIPTTTVKSWIRSGLVWDLCVTNA